MEPAPVKQEEPRATTVLAKVPSILLLEDSEDDFLLLKRSCERASLRMKLSWVTTPAGAIRYLKGEDMFQDRVYFPFPSLVMVDLNLPGESGLDLLKWIRKQPELNELRVWVFSNSMDASDASQAYQLGANSYEVKPNLPEEWRTLIQSLKICLESAGGTRTSAQAAPS